MKARYEYYIRWYSSNPFCRFIGPVALRLFTSVTAFIVCVNTAEFHPTVIVNYQIGISFNGRNAIIRRLHAIFLYLIFCCATTWYAWKAPLMTRLLLDYKLSFNSLARKRCSSISKYVIFKHFVVSDIWKFLRNCPQQNNNSFHWY